MNAPARAPTPARIHAALLAVQVFFATWGVVGKIALRALPAFPLASVRVGAAAALFLVLWALRGAERVPAADLARIAVYAFFGIVANQLLFLAGLSRTTATNAVVLSTSIPIFTVGIAVALGREQATRWKIGGLLLGLSGALLLTGASARFDGDSRALVGNLLILANSFSYSIYLVISRPMLARRTPLTVITWVMVFGAVGILPLGAVGFVERAPLLDRQTWGAIAFIVAFPTVGAYLLNTIALRHVPASLVAIYVYVQPVMGVTLAAVVLGERPSPYTALAALLIFSGVALVNRAAAEDRPPPPSRIATPPEPGEA